MQLYVNTRENVLVERS